MRNEEIIVIVKNIYEKSLPCMRNKVIRYNICENLNGDVINYGIEIAESSDGLSRKEIVEDISPDKDFVYNLITYLCENVVDVTHFKDIVEDYILMCEKV